MQIASRPCDSSGAFMHALGANHGGQAWCHAGMQINYPLPIEPCLGECVMIRVRVPQICVAMAGIAGEATLPYISCQGKHHLARCSLPPSTATSHQWTADGLHCIFHVAYTSLLLQCMGGTQLGEWSSWCVASAHFMSLRLLQHNWE